MKIAILGAGLSGIELGRNLKKMGKDFVIFEKESQIGGMCRTNKTEGYYWDFAVHAIYSPHKEAMDFFYSLPLDYGYLNRNVKVLHTGTNGKKYILEYPFEIGIKDMPLREKIDCLKGYISVNIRRRGRSCGNLEEWINNRLGPGIAKNFMVPYNNKIWNCQLNEISNTLVNSKIEPSSILNFTANIFGKRTVGRIHQARFIYPKNGIQQLIDYIAKDIKEKIMLKSDIKQLIRKGNKWIICTDAGYMHEVDVVISTIPLVELLKNIINMDGIEKKYDELRWNNTFFVMVGLKRGRNFEIIQDCHWVFLKEEEIFYRITLMHNFSPEFLPTIVAEVTQKGHILDKTGEEITNIVVKELIGIGIIRSIDDVAQTDIKLVNYTYPIPTIGLEKVKNKISSIFKKHNLFLLGRNGNWDYVNMDGVILKVKEFVNNFFLTLVSQNAIR